MDIKRHPSLAASTMGSEDSLVDMSTSTAPTTPDGSLTFSPVLQALKLEDALEDAAMGRNTQRTSNSSLEATIYRGRAVKNICCIGAGYVGM
jgi:UDPglucose 6-dehydrogenase